VKDQYNAKPENDEIEIDLVRLVKALWSHVLIILLAGVIFAGAAFAYSYYLIDPTYEANCKVYVNNSSINIGSTALSLSSGDLTTSKSLVPTYIVILQSRTTLNEVIKQANLSYTYSELLSMISASSVSDTAVFNIKVTSTNPDEAKLIANTIAKVLPQKVAEIIDGTSVRIVDYAITPVVKAAPSITKNTAVGFIAGFVIMCVYIVIRDLLDDVIHDDDYLSQNINLPILGLIPDLDEEGTKENYYYYKRNGKYYQYQYYDKYKGRGKHSELAKQFVNAQVELEPSSEEEKAYYKSMQKMLFSNMSFAAAEAYKLLRTNINFIASDSSCKIIGITSSTRGEGKSTTSLNLAYTLAETGKDVLLIDADLRIPTISKRLGIDQEAGLSSVLAGFTTVENVITSSKIFKRWHVIPAGVVPPNPNELLGLKRMQQLLETLSQSYDYIILDLPPVNIVADALTVAGCLDGMIAVVRQDYSSLNEIKQMLSKFSLIGIKPLGLVFVDVADRAKGYKYSKYRKYSTYRYKKDRYNDYGYSSYYEGKTYPDPRIYAKQNQKAKDKKMMPVIELPREKQEDK